MWSVTNLFRKGDLDTSWVVYFMQKTKRRISVGGDHIAQPFHVNFFARSYPSCKIDDVSDKIEIPRGSIKRTTEGPP